MVNYNQAYLESLVKPGSNRLSILVDNCQILVSLAQPGFTRLTSLLTRLLVQGIGDKTTINEIVKFHNGESDCYLKRGHKAYRQKTMVIRKQTT